MALARVVSFEGVTSDRMAQLRNQIESGDPPEGMPPAELMILHDAEGERSLAIVVFDNPVAAGSVNVAPVTLDGPLLVTRTVYVVEPPAFTLETPSSFVTCRSATGLTVS